MNQLWQPILDSIKHPNYPEFLAFFGILLCFCTFNLSTPHLVLTLLLLSTGALSLGWLIAKPDYLFHFFSINILLVLTISLLQLNYVPTLLLLLLIASRIVLIEKEYATPLMMTTLIVGILTSLSSNLLLPQLSLTDSEQILLNFVSLSLSIIVISYRFYALLFIIHELEADNEQQAQRIQDNMFTINKLSQFLPPQVSYPIIHYKGNVPFVVQRHKLTVLFSDIVGFTQLSDNISPDELSSILNTYMEKMTEIAYRYGATLDKFMGDGLLCFFGDSGNRSDRENAILCAKMAIEMRREMQLLGKKWRLLGFNSLSLRIGINTGYCYVGSFGSIKRMNYTLIGKESNLASRLETAANPNQILISDSTYQLIRHSQFCQIIGLLELKGFDEPIKVWELLDPDPNRGYAIDNGWVIHELPGFNVHLNFADIRNYDKQTIIDHLNDALDIVENHKF